MSTGSSWVTRNLNALVVACKTHVILLQHQLVLLTSAQELADMFAAVHPMGTSPRVPCHSEADMSMLSSSSWGRSTKAAAVLHLGVMCFACMQAAKELPCGHIYHLGCLRDWLQQSGTDNFTCPICRTPLFVKNQRHPGLRML